MDSQVALGKTMADSLTVTFSPDGWTVVIETPRGVAIYSLAEVLILYGWLLQHSEQIERAMVARERTFSWVRCSHTMALVA